MPDSDSYEHTDEEDVVSPCNAKKAPVVRKTKTVEKKEDEHRKYFDTAEEYEKWLHKTEKEREQELFNRMEEYDDRQNKEKIRLLLEKREAEKQRHANNKLLPDSDVYSCGDDENSPIRRTKKPVPVRFDKGVVNSKRYNELFGTSSSSSSEVSSESSSEDDDNDYVPPPGSFPPPPKKIVREASASLKSELDTSVIPQELVEYKEDLLPARLTRSQLARIVHAPFFKDTVKGAFVMIHVGVNRNLPSESIICEVRDVFTTPKRYHLENTETNKTLNIRFGDYVTNFRLMFVSNREWTSQQFDEYKAAAERAKVLPTREAIRLKKVQLNEALNHCFTHKEINTMIEEKRKELQMPENRITKKTALLTKLKYAEANQLHRELQEIRLEISKLDAEDRQPEQKQFKSDLLEGILKNKPKRNKTETWTTPQKRVDLLQSGDDPFTRKKARPRVISGARSRSDLTEISPMPSTRVISNTNPTTGKNNSAEVDDFELYNSLKIDIDLTLPYKPDL